MNNPIDYNGNDLPVYFSGDWEEDQGAHVRCIVYSNEPESSEIGYDAAESVTGFIQLGVFLPASDRGLNFTLNEIPDQFRRIFRRSSFVEGNLKIEWLNVAREEPLRIDGHYSITARVNYRYFHCN